MIERRECAQLTETDGVLPGSISAPKPRMRNGPPLPPLIFVGNATTEAQVGGNRSSAATFTKAGMFRSNKTRWLSNSVDCP